MPLQVSCTGCGRTLRVADDAAGKQARCPACGTISRIPEPSAAGAPAFSSAVIPTDFDSGYAPPKSEPLENPFAETGSRKSLPYGPGVNPFGESRGTYSSNPYQPPSAYGYAPPRHRLASRGKRFLGALLDSFFLLLGAAPGIVLALILASQDEDLATIGILVAMVGAFIVGIVNWVMISNSGQSIAKRMLGMQIVKFDTGELPGFMHGVLLRSWIPAAINQACSLFSLIDALWIFGEECRCLHDLIAQTVVIDV